MFNLEVKGMRAAKRAVDPKIYRAAERSAIKKVTTKGKTTTARAVNRLYRIKQSDIKRQVRQWMAKGGDVRSSTGWLAIRFKKRGIGLLNFGAKAARGRIVTSRSKDGGLQSQRLKRNSRNQGVSYQILRAGGRKSLPGGFIARGRRGSDGLSGGNAQVFVRGKNGSLIPKRMIEPASMFGHKAVLKSLDRMVRSDFPKLMDHEVRRRLKK